MKLSTPLSSLMKSLFGLGSKKIEILLSYDDGDFSKAIRLTTKSRWSHAAIVCGDFVYEALASSGVTKTPLSTAKERAKEWKIVSFRHPDPDLVYQIAESLVGSEYDRLWVASFFTNQRFHSKNAFVCSEYVAYCLQEAGKKLFKDDDYSRVIPDTFDMLHPDI